MTQREELAPIDGIYDDLITTILDSSPEELPELHAKLTALASALDNREALKQAELRGTERAIDAIVKRYNIEIASISPEKARDLKKLKHGGYAAMLWGVAIGVKSSLEKELEDGLTPRQRMQKLESKLLNEAGI